MGVLRLFSYQRRFGWLRAGSGEPGSGGRGRVPRIEYGAGSDFSGTPAYAGAGSRGVGGRGCSRERGLGVALGNEGAVGRRGLAGICGIEGIGNG